MWGATCTVHPYYNELMATCNSVFYPMDRTQMSRNEDSLTECSLSFYNMYHYQTMPWTTPHQTDDATGMCKNIVKL